MGGRLPWPALVLTAGCGTRFRPLSDARAKPAAPVAGIPLIRRILAWLARAGVADVVLNLHYKPETITAVVGDGSDLGVSARYCWEPAILGSAGGPARARPLLDAPRFFIINGDTLADVNLAALAVAHEASGALVTLAVVPNPDPERYGGVLVDESGGVRRFAAPGTPGNAGSLHFVGVQVAESRVFDGVPPGGPSETIRELYPDLIARDPASVASFRAAGAFRDIGTPADYLATSLDLAHEEGLDALPAGRQCRLSPTARLVRTAVWDEVTVGDRCEIVDSVLADGVSIPAGTRLTRCAVVRAAGREARPGETRQGDLIVARL